MKNATFHPDTGEMILLPFRFSCFVPTNMAVIAGMLIPNPSTATLLFWQFTNQSINVMFNYHNANKSKPMSMTEAATAHAAAVAVSCSVAYKLNKIKMGRIFSALIPFVAVSTASATNVFLMRYKELVHGISISDDNGNKMGESRVAAMSALSQVALSRVAIAFPCLTIPPLFLNFFKPKYKTPWNLALICASLSLALPLAIGIFPQESRVPVESLEKNFHNLYNGTERITHVRFNKGL